MTSLPQRLASFRILPVVTCCGVTATVKLAETLAASGIECIEITLRTPDALQCLAAIKDKLPDLMVAAGTITTPENMEKAADAGADFCVSPGISAGLLTAATSRHIPLLPGVATPSEVMLGLEHGCDVFKLFPAEAVGGTALLKSLAGPFPEIRFCPTGGLTADNLQAYLALSNVICCGGSWMVSTELVEAQAWSEIERLTREAVALTR